MPEDVIENDQQWKCPITLDTAVEIFVLRCGHSVSSAIYQAVTRDIYGDCTVKCPLCRMLTGLTTTPDTMEQRLATNFALQEMNAKLVASLPVPVVTTESLEHRRIVHQLETSQTNLAIAESRVTLTAQNLAELEVKYTELKRSHEDLAYDFAYSVPTLRTRETKRQFSRETDRMQKRMQDRMQERQRKLRRAASRLRSPPMF